MLVPTQRPKARVATSPEPTLRRLSRDLVRPAKELFVLWQKVRDGTLSRPAFVEQMKPIRAEVEIPASDYPPNAIFLYSGWLSVQCL